MSHHKSIKLYYFNLRGRAECIRQLLALANVQYENIIVDKETWPSLKEDMPLGQVPVLEVDGVKIGQSIAIARFIGHEYGFKGETNLENARLDMIADLLGELSNCPESKEWVHVLLGYVNVDNKELFFKEKVRPKMESYANTVEKFIVENGSNLLCGDKVTWVDVFAAETFSRFTDYGEPDCLEAYPHIQSLIGRIQNIPQIRNHIANRPKTAL